MRSSERVVPPICIGDFFLKKKVKKPKWYNILIVPEGKPAQKQLTVPSWTHKAIFAFLGVWFVATIVLAGTAYYYRTGWMATEETRITTREIKEKEAVISEKLASMEEVVGRANRLAQRLEAAVGINKKVMLKSIGPIADEDTLPDAKKLKLNSKYELTAKVENNPRELFNDLDLQTDELNDTIASVEMRLQDVYEFHQERLTYWASMPSIWPVRGWVTSEFGPRRSPKGIGSRFHEGLDIAASIGTPVFASGDGVVTFSGYKNGLGKTVIIDHGFGVTTVYGHNSALYVQEGQKIKRGSNIAAVGRTGRSTGPHLHYQIVVDGVPVDPMRYIIENF